MKQRMLMPLALMMVTGLAISGCGSNGDLGSTGSADASGEASPSEPAGSETSSEAPELAQGVTDNKIHLGTVLPLTGAAAVAAEGVQAGLQAAIGEVNQAGGIAGREIELTVLDDNFDSATHVANFRRLDSQEGVFAVLVPAGSANLPGVWPLAEESGIPVFGPYLPDCPQVQSVFCLGTGHADQVRVLVDILAEQEGASTFAVIAQDNDLGQAIEEGLRDKAEELGLEVVAAERVQPNDTNISSAVLNVQGANPDAVILGTDGTQSSLILKQADELDWNPLFAGTSSTASTYSTVVTEPAGPGAEGLYGSFFAASPSEESTAVTGWQQSLEAHAANGDDYTTSSFALHGYAFAKVFFEILENMGDELTWPNFYEQAESLEGFETQLLPSATFGPLPDGHLGTRGAGVAKFEAGNWTAVTSDWVEP